MIDNVIEHVTCYIPFLSLNYKYLTYPLYISRDSYRCSSELHSPRSLTACLGMFSSLVRRIRGLGLLVIVLFLHAICIHSIMLHILFQLDIIDTNQRISLYSCTSNSTNNGSGGTRDGVCRVIYTMSSRLVQTEIIYIPYIYRAVLMFLIMIL